MDEEGLKHLAASIELHGILQPLLLRREEDGGLRIVAGERRWRAAGMAGLQEVPARILTTSETEARELSLIENVQRKDLSPIEVASALAAMIERSSLTQEECADRLGWSRALVANRLRLLKLPDEVRGLLIRTSSWARRSRGLDIATSRRSSSMIESGIRPRRSATARGTSRMASGMGR